MSVASAWQLSFGFLSRPIAVEPVDEVLTSDAGLLPLRELDERLGLCWGLAARLSDCRAACGTRHTLLEMVRSRVLGIVAGYEDQNDHDLLRSDATFKLVAGRLPADDDLASQPTLSRFENAVTARSLLKLEQWFIERFVRTAKTLPKRVTLDIDVFDDPTHGAQQLTFFHGYYRQHQYLVRVITCAENDQAVLGTLLHGTAHPTLGADEDVTRVVAALRTQHPDVRVHLRADSAYGSPGFYQACERLEIDYTIGLGMNATLKRHSDALLEQAVRHYEETGQPQRLFTAFWYQAQSWDIPRWVVVKCEAHAQGTNRRAIVTNRPGARVLPEAAYDEYTERGESENRNKELKCHLHTDRLSDHRYMANAFRMFLHLLAHNLLVHARDLPPKPKLPAPAGALPVEALADYSRRQHFNRRRRADPLGEGHAGTWRTMLIKVAARVVVSTRRVRVLLSASWPFLNFYRQFSEAVLALPRVDSS